MSRAVLATMGTKTFALEHRFQDWRCGLKGTESVWYSDHMTLVRTAIGETLSACIHRLKEALEAYITV